MGFKDGAKKSARFVAVDLPKGVLGTETLKRNNEHIKDMYKTLTLPKCPYCANGVLQQISETTWQCHDCQENIPGKSKEEVQLFIAQVQQTRYVEEGLTDKQRSDGLRNHTIYARIFYIIALGCLVYFVIGLATGVSLLVAFARLFIGLAFFVNALKNAYRAYQFKEDRFYIQGEFYQWFKRVQWWV